MDSTVSRPACLCRPVCLPLLAVCSPRRSCRTTACPGFVLASLECFSRAFMASSCSCLTHTTTRNSLLIFNIVGFPHYLTIQTCKLFVQISPRGVFHSDKFTELVLSASQKQVPRYDCLTVYTLHRHPSLNTDVMTYSCASQGNSYHGLFLSIVHK